MNMAVGMVMGRVNIAFRKGMDIFLAEIEVR